MSSLFRTLILMLVLTAPGDVQCNRQFTTCWVSFRNPAYTETVTPTDLARIRALIEIKQLEAQK